MKKNTLSQIKAVLFDLDGVLIDSMPHHVAAWKEVFSELGVDLPAEILRRSEGEKAKVTIMKLAPKYGLNLSDEQFDRLLDKKRSRYRQTAPRGMRPVAKEAIETCRKIGLKTAIVTGSVRSNLEWTLSDEERAMFDIILSSEYYNKGKPHPEPYLNAAKQLGLPPEACLVMENAPLGIQSAKAAGMFCVAITTTLPASDLSDADLIVPDIDHLKVLLNPDDKKKKSGG